MTTKYSDMSRLPKKPEKGSNEYFAQAIAHSMMELIIPVVEKRSVQIVETMFEHKMVPKCEECKDKGYLYSNEPDGYDYACNCPAGKRWSTQRALDHFMYRMNTAKEQNQIGYICEIHEAACELFDDLERINGTI